MTQPNTLRVILEALLEHRAALRASAPSEPIRILNFADMLKPDLKSPWRTRMERAAKDGVEESLHASIGEEGWRAFAAGGVDAMRALANDACCNGQMLSVVDHRWDGIGTEAGGYWRS